MSEKRYEALEVCLQALETGATPESVVKLFPEMEADLLPLLETSRQAKMLAIAEVPETVLLRNRARLLQHAATMRNSAPKPTKRRALVAFPRLAISLAFALLFFLSGTNLVRASNGALPGDNLYTVKRTWEDVRLMLVINPESREELESEFGQERLHEVDELLAEGRHETITFAGVVTEQQGNMWVVSGVPVQLTADSRLPEALVTVGTSVMLQGRTNAQSFVEADFIALLGSNVVLPSGVPTQIETQEGDSNPGQIESQENNHSGEEETQPGSPTGEDHDSDNSDSGKNQGSSEADHSGESSGGHTSQSEDSKSDNSGSGRDENSKETRD